MHHRQPSLGVCQWQRSSDHRCSPCSCRSWFGGCWQLHLEWLRGSALGGQDRTSRCSQTDRVLSPHTHPWNHCPRLVSVGRSRRSGKAAGMILDRSNPLAWASLGLCFGWCSGISSSLQVRLASSRRTFLQTYQAWMLYIQERPRSGKSHLLSSDSLGHRRFLRNRQSR